MATAGPLDAKTAESLLRGLECPVCQDYFTEPRMLPCGHTLCLRPCLQQVAGSSPRVKCPECRTEHVVPESGVQGFPLNVTVVRQLETRPKDLVETNGLTSECPKCAKVEDLSECGHCHLKLCNGCLKEHVEKVREEIVERSQNVKRRADDMLSIRKDIILDNIWKSAEEALTKIEDNMQEIVSLVERKADELKTQVVARRDRDIGEVSGKLTEFRKSWTDVRTISDAGLQIAANKDTSPSQLTQMSEQLKRASQKAPTEKPEIKIIAVNMDTSIITDVMNNFEITSSKMANDAKATNHTASSEYNQASTVDMPASNGVLGASSSPSIPSVERMCDAYMGSNLRKSRGGGGRFWDRVPRHREPPRHPPPGGWGSPPRHHSPDHPPPHGHPRGRGRHHRPDHHHSLDTVDPTDANPGRHRGPPPGKLHTLSRAIAKPFSWF